MRTVLLCFLAAVSMKNSFGQKLVNPMVDNTSYTGKAMFGYQAWFGHPEDDSQLINYWHWGNLDEIGRQQLEVEMYPDLREFCDDEQYITNYYFEDGKPANVFSSVNKKTISRHMKWLRDYHTDGVFLQRFISEYKNPYIMAFRDSVSVAVKEGCEKYGRVFSIMYDGVQVPIEVIKNDWIHLIDDLMILSTDRYLHHEDKPLVGLWGYTFYDQATVEELEELIDWFHHSAPEKYRASIKLGVNDHWFNLNQDWKNAFAKVEVISPWSVGRFNDQDTYNIYLDKQLKVGKKWCDNREILFAPVLFPGFSWHNLREGTPKNEIPRDGGNFFWMQAYGAIQNNFETMYFAMFDELDEATAFFKTAEDSLQAPAQQYWLNLDADGFKLPSDWYLRCAGHAAETLRGNIPNRSILEEPIKGLMTIRPNNDECALQFSFPDFENADLIEISLDGGITFPYSVQDSVGVFEIKDLSRNNYDIFVRSSGAIAIPMGEVCINCKKKPNDNE